MAVEVVQTDVSNVSKALAIIGAFVVFYGPFSFIIKERIYLSEPLLAVVYGIIVGPIALKWVDPFSWGSEHSIRYLTYQIMRMALGVQVLFCGVSLPARYVERNWRSLAVLLMGIMTIAWFVCGLLIWGLIPKLTFLESLCLAAAITPTDPILSNGIASFADPILGDLIIAEGGANDGLGFPYLYLPIFLMRRRPDGPDAGLSIGTEIGRWIYSTLIYRILLSIVYGYTVGFVARKVLKWAERRQYVERNNFFAYSFCLALFCLGTCGLFNSDDILACFVAGNSLTHNDWYRLRTLDNDTQEILDFVINLVIFVYSGTIIPFHKYTAENDLEAWRVIVLALCVLCVRRLPWIMLLKRFIPALASMKEAAFCGWFGPIGVSAIYMAQLAHDEIPESRTRLREIYHPVVIFMVLGSVVVHGITIPMLQFYPKVRTFTQTRSLTITRPSQTQIPSLNITTTPSDSDAAPAPAADRPVQKVDWNPLQAVYVRAQWFLCFWRPNSFWRVPPKEMLSRDRHVNKAEITGPINGRLIHTVVPERHEGGYSSPLPTSRPDTRTSTTPPDPLFQDKALSTVTFQLEKVEKLEKLETGKGGTPLGVPSTDSGTRTITREASPSVHPESDSDCGAGAVGRSMMMPSGSRGDSLWGGPTSYNRPRPPPPALILPQ